MCFRKKLELSRTFCTFTADHFSVLSHVATLLRHSLSLYVCMYLFYIDICIYFFYFQTHCNYLFIYFFCVCMRLCIPLFYVLTRMHNRQRPLSVHMWICRRWNHNISLPTPLSTSAHIKVGRVILFLGAHWHCQRWVYSAACCNMPKKQKKKQEIYSSSTLRTRCVCLQVIQVTIIFPQQ